MDRYAVIGNPIKQSKSPWIHAKFADQTHQQLAYRAILVELDQFESFVEEFFATGGAGLNITVPFKERAWAMAQELNLAASSTGAVNTLYRDSQGRLVGANTDGVGLLRDLKENYGALLKDKRVLLLGAGGAVKGVLPNLVAESPNIIYLANRDLEKAKTVAARMHGAVPVEAVSYAGIPAEPFDLVINGTSAGLYGEVPPIPSAVVNTHTWCYDMLYGVGDTAFQKWAKEQNASKALDGLGMLVEQAAEAFRIWRGVSPETKSVISELRQLLV